MEFSANHPILFVMVGIIIAVVLGQSFYFLFRAMKRAKEIGTIHGNDERIRLETALRAVEFYVRLMGEC